jgi:hypothetical protein
MVKSKVHSLISGLQEIDNQLGKTFYLVTHLSHMVIRLLGLRSFSKYFRFLEISTIPFKKYDENIDSCSNIEILFVTTAKDFQILRSAIRFAQKATSQHNSVKFIILVPDHEVELCNSLLIDLNLPISVIQESAFISDAIRKRIKDNFGVRTGWVLQQILKDFYVKKFSTPIVLFNLTELYKNV